MIKTQEQNLAMMEDKFKNIKHFSSIIEKHLPNKREKTIVLYENNNSIQNSLVEFRIDGCKDYTYVFSIPENDLMEVLNNFRLSLGSSNLRKLSFQDELIILKGAARYFEAQTELNPTELRLINLIYTFTDFFLFSHYSISKYLNLDDSFRFMDEITEHFNFISEYIKCDNFKASNIKSTVCILASYSQNESFEDIMLDNIKEIEKYDYPNITFKFIESNKKKCIKEVFNEIPKGCYLFILGHGDDEDDHFDVYIGNRPISIDSDEFVKIFERLPLESIALLSCAHDSFRSTKENLETNNLILPNKSSNEYSEAIIKSFCYEMNKSGNFEKAYDMSKYSTYFTSLDGVTINKY